MRFWRQVRLPMRGAVAVAAVFLTVSALAGCGGGTTAVATWSDPSASGPSSTPSPTSSSAASGQPGPPSSSPEAASPQSGPSQSDPTTADPPPPPPPAGAQYRVVDSLCTYVSFNALTTVLPHVSVGPYEGPRIVDTGMGCLADLGTTPDADQHGGFFIVVEISASAAEARASFEHFRDVNSGFDAFADIAGIGDRAFQALVPYAVPAPTVRVQHGNAEFIASWDPLVAGPLPDGIFPALVQTIRATMTSLPSP